jgi:hypothetical protein
MATKPEQELVSAATPLTVPCTLNAMRNWLKGVDVVTPGKEGGTTVNATATTITVA